MSKWIFLLLILVASIYCLIPVVQLLYAPTDFGVDLASTLPCYVHAKHNYLAEPLE